MSELLKNILRFALLMILQVFVLNQLLINELVVPSVYFLFILLLPFELPRWSVLLCGFLTGLCLDMFMNTHGMHAAACVFIAFLRPAVLNFLSRDKEFETKYTIPSVFTMGWVPFLSYAILLAFIHHVVYFFLEVFDFSSLFYLSVRIIFSTVLTLAMIIVYEFLFARPKSRSLS